MRTRRLLAWLWLLIGVSFGTDVQAFYNPTTGRWPNRDPLNEMAFLRHGVLTLQEEPTPRRVDHFSRRERPEEDYVACANDLVCRSDYLGLADGGGTVPIVVPGAPAEPTPSPRLGMPEEPQRPLPGISRSGNVGGCQNSASGAAGAIQRAAWMWSKGEPAWLIWWGRKQCSKQSPQSISADLTGKSCRCCVIPIIAIPAGGGNWNHRWSQGRVVQMDCDKYKALGCYLPRLHDGQRDVTEYIPW